MNTKKDDDSKIPVELASCGTGRRRIPVVLGGMAGLTMIYYAIYFGLDGSKLVRPAAQFCPNNEPGCSRSDLFGMQMVATIMQLYLGGMGLWTWHVTKRALALNTAESRLFGYLQEADYLNVGIIIFQLWDFIFSMTIPEHNKTEFLIHHALSGLTAIMSLEYQMMHHYAIFFGGCSEISSMFLVLCDLDVFFPASQYGSAIWSAIILSSQVGFTLTYMYYRLLGWWTVSYQLWNDVLQLQPKAEQYRPGQSWFLYVFLLMDVLLGLLQIYWFGFGIIPKILEILK